MSAGNRNPYPEVVRELCALDLAGLHALGANVSALYFTVNLDGYLLDIRTEGTIAYAMGVADATTSAGCLTADLANFGHSNQLHLLSYLVRLDTVDFQKPEHYTTVKNAIQENS